MKHVFPKDLRRSTLKCFITAIFDKAVIYPGPVFSVAQGVRGAGGNQILHTRQEQYEKMIKGKQKLNVRGSDTNCKAIRSNLLVSGVVVNPTDCCEVRIRTKRHFQYIKGTHILLTTHVT